MSRTTAFGNVDTVGSGSTIRKGVGAGKPGRSLPSEAEI